MIPCSGRASATTVVIRARWRKAISRRRRRLKLRRDAPGCRGVTSCEEHDPGPSMDGAVPPAESVPERGEVNEGTTTLVDLPAVPKRQEDAAQATVVRGEHFLGDGADREHLAVEGDFALIAKPRTGRPVNADTGAATIVTPAEVPSLGTSPERTRRCPSVSRCPAGSRPCRTAGRASRAVPRPGGRRGPDAPEIIYCTAVAGPMDLLPAPAPGRAAAKAARHGRPTAARKR